MGLKEEREIIVLLKRLNDRVRDDLNAISLETRRNQAYLIRIDKILSRGVPFPLPVDPAVEGEIIIFDDNGQEMRGKMLFKADFEGAKKFRVLTRDKKGNLADVETFELRHSDVLMSVIERKDVGTYEGEFKLSGKVGETQLEFVGDGDKGPDVKVVRAVSEVITVIAADAEVADIVILPDEVEVPVDPTPVEPVQPEPVPEEPVVAKAKPLRAGASQPLKK